MNQVRKRMRRGLALLLAVLQVMLVFAVVPVSAADDVVDSGTCGENLTWVLNSEGTLTISGTDAMTDYSLDNNAPWYGNRVNIKAVNIENGVTVIGTSAFSDCSNLTDVTIPDSVVGISSAAFSGCSSLSSIVIPDSVGLINAAAFMNCSSLSSIKLPNNACGLLIEGSAFMNCVSLSSIELPNNVEHIGDTAFYGCRNLIDIIIPDGISTIEFSTFGSCTKLSSVIISKSVTTIEEGAFSDCYNLVDVYYDGSEEDWSNIDIDDGNDPLLNTTIHYNSIGLDEGEYNSPQTSVWYQVWGSGDRDYTGDVTLQVGDQTYTQKVYNRLSANIPTSDANKVSISKEGYFTCKIPRELVYLRKDGIQL